MTNTDPRALVERLRNVLPDGCGNYFACDDAADALTAALDEIEWLRRGLEACQDEIDGYIRQEYPADHPVHERYRQRDFAANPARLALKGSDQ